MKSAGVDTRSSKRHGLPNFSKDNPRNTPNNREKTFEDGRSEDVSEVVFVGDFARMNLENHAWGYK
jgi:hypothetical protein